MTARGRPRSFDRAVALEKAMEVFWARGYAGASIAELTEVMGINSPSLYAAFGSKEELFKEAVALYVATDDSCTLQMLEGDLTTRDSIAAMLAVNARSCLLPDRPSGCFLMIGATNGGPETDAAQQYLCDKRKDMAARIRARLERGVADGELPAGLNLDRIAAYFATVIKGMSIEARDGADAETLAAVARSAMFGWDAITSTQG
ncbi:TetR/AcrR family transcriptional regulator [Kaistia dalseonensis]|uniref:AcrR family transcriptional regulator n=1 Tax=Kaistia dalseonensis TaxID=410840 RepID=A0ABU0H9Y3_9HYPH|nr:TetR/AcrR family transcriptional regulator [Kaistia dalseonensis]MCX5496473.1 TetR/AcrR family transcriptional regulator [Kaistia dalseonensis]MDQ0439095.1 AcrR family transcriptional regulator [Kaistia dalseonensis]